MRYARSALVASLLAALAIPAQMMGQEQSDGQQQKQHTRYKLIDMGTLGSPASYVNPGSGDDATNFAAIVNNQATLTGYADTAQLSETSVMFPGQNVGTTSGTQTIYLTNTGEETLNVTDIDTTAHFAESDSCVGSLAPATSCEINITFTPSTTGSLTGTLWVTDNASGSPQAVNLSGAGIISHNKLTGACLVLRPTPNLWRCYLIAVPDPKQCPAGQTANEPVREEGCLFLPSPSPLEDISRSCHAEGFGGVCAAK